MQTLVIGDIHGCYDEFRSLLDKAGLTEGDFIVSVGDCVDRGPDTPAVLRFFQEKPNTLLIMGNHERKHVRADRHEVKLARSQKISSIQFGETYPDALAFMSELPLYLDLPGAWVVHGYWDEISSTRFRFYWMVRVITGMRRKGELIYWNHLAMVSSHLVRQRNHNRSRQPRAGR
jgi:hypothetical protein